MLSIRRVLAGRPRCGAARTASLGTHRSSSSASAQPPDASAEHYDPHTCEPRWQQYWATHATFAAPRVPRDRSKKKYVLDMFPYPSAEGLHVGHPLGYTASDAAARFWRHCGFDVLHPMGWDAFGLPAEQHAIKTGEQPAISTARNIACFKRQLQVHLLPLLRAANPQRKHLSPPNPHHAVLLLLRFSRSASRTTGTVSWQRRTQTTSVGRNGYSYSCWRRVLPCRCVTARCRRRRRLPDLLPSPPILAAHDLRVLCTARCHRWRVK